MKKLAYHNKLSFPRSILLSEAKAVINWERVSERLKGIALLDSILSNANIVYKAKALISKFLVKSVMLNNTVIWTTGRYQEDMLLTRVAVLVEFSMAMKTVEKKEPET